MNTPELFRKLRNKFTTLLKRKPGWGRNEALEQFDAACVELLGEVLDEQSPPVPRVRDVNRSLNQSEGAPF